MSARSSQIAAALVVALAALAIGAATLGAKPAPARTPATAAAAAAAKTSRKRKSKRELRRFARRCGKIPRQGCCDGQRLYFCRGGRLATLDCSTRRRCGWHKRGFYDCNTSGAVDPLGRVAKACFFGKKGRPLPAAGNACGKLTVEGCCDDSGKLHFCDDGRPRALACGANQACGWRGVAQLYNCGTDGSGDPRGRHPQKCSVLLKGAGSSKGSGSGTGKAQGSKGKGAGSAAR